MRPLAPNGGPTRGEVWTVRFDPTQGAEINKTRPAVILNIALPSTMPLRIVVPITGWDQRWSSIPWIVPLRATDRNGLKKDSAADCFQVKSVSLTRVVSRIGRLDATELQEISAAVAICVGA